MRDENQWPPYTREQPNYYIFNAEKNGMGKGPRTTACAFWNEFLPRLKGIPGKTSISICVCVTHHPRTPHRLCSTAQALIFSQEAIYVFPIFVLRSLLLSRFVFFSLSVPLPAAILFSRCSSLLPVWCSSLFYLSDVLSFSSALECSAISCEKFFFNFYDYHSLCSEYHLSEWAQTKEDQNFTRIFKSNKTDIRSWWKEDYIYCMTYGSIRKMKTSPPTSKIISILAAV